MQGCGVTPGPAPSSAAPTSIGFDAVRTFDPRVLLGDRLGLTLYHLVARALLDDASTPALGWYERFVRHCGETGEHGLARFAEVIDALSGDGFDPMYPVYANPREFTLLNGSHRCAAAIALGVTTVPYHLRYADSRTPTDEFAKIFSADEWAELAAEQDRLIGACPTDIAFTCRVRRHLRAHEESFRAPFASKTRLPIVRPYQGSERLGIRGKRRTETRMAAYGLPALLRGDMRVLEIGCNCGFLSLEIARLVRQVTAFDVDPNYIALGALAQRRLGVTNCTFGVGAVETYRPAERFDAVLSCAVHGWITMDFGAYVAYLRSIITPGGLLLFESHEVDCHPEWRAQRAFLLQRFDLVRQGWIDDVDEDVYESELREFLVLRVPR
jgi:2-polyprenyl-3-methyl-5-hydroxy-6-metoxy-1,4-benzoquinol methylase